VSAVPHLRGLAAVFGAAALLTSCRFQPDGSGQRGAGGSGAEICVTTSSCDDVAKSARLRNSFYVAGPSALPPELTPPAGVTSCGALYDVGTTVYYVANGIAADVVVNHYRSELTAAGYVWTQTIEGCEPSFSFVKGASRGQLEQSVEAGSYSVQYGIP
jgi:hypothetical protein